MIRWINPIVLILLLVGVLLAQSDEEVLEPEEVNKKIVQGYMNVIEDPDFRDWNKYFSKTVTFNGERIPPKALTQLLGSFRQGFPDLEFTRMGQIAEGDTVATWGFFEGTHKGEFNGVKPTEQHCKWFGIGVDRLKGGKVVELWHEMDLWGLMQTLEAARKD
jgi:predicted ester cyclase